MPTTLPKLFPRFHRINSARLVSSLETLLLWVGLTLLILINILSLRTSRPAYWNELLRLFAAPSSVSRHMDTASVLWGAGFKQEASAIMTSAQSLAEEGTRAVEGGTVGVLGATTSPREVLLGWEHEEDALKRRYRYWQSVAGAKPDYRDAYITLSLLAYQLGNADASGLWLARAENLDPNHEAIARISQLLTRGN